jgi:hypothetical protein
MDFGGAAMPTAAGGRMGRGTPVPFPNSSVLPRRRGEGAATRRDGGPGAGNTL